MGQLIKNHWARLLLLTAATVHLAATIECFFWPKIFWDFSSRRLDPAIRPVPILQILNLLSALFSIAWEWPLPPIAATRLHSSIIARLLVYPTNTILVALMYQGFNAALFYLVAMAVWLWAFWDKETVCVEPWTLPPKQNDKLDGMV